MYFLGERTRTLVEISLDHTVKGYRQSLVSQLRGGISNMFSESAFHQHDQEGRFIYRYPKIQYQWITNQGIILGWMESAEKILHLPWLDFQITLNGINLSVTKANLTTESAVFGVSKNLVHYRLETPTLLFNRNNYKAYKSMSFKERIYETDRLLQAQVLIALRGLDILFPERLYATFTQLKTMSCQYKGQRLLGIGGRFATNAFLPENFAIGHAVSHGYGWIEPIKKEV